MEKPQNPMQGAATAAYLANLSLHARQFSIPVLNNFEKLPNPNPQTVFMAAAKTFTQQLISDGPLKQGETFQQRIDLVKKNTIEGLNVPGIYSDECTFFFFKDYKGKTFDYKIYIQDLVLDSKGTKVVIRMFNAYFIEPNFNDFYQLSLSVGPMKMPTEILKLGVADLEHDKVSMATYIMLTSLLDNLKYKQ